MSESRVRAGLAGLADLLRASQELSPRVAALASRYASVLRSGRTLFFCGNGGSAADAQHLATEYVVRYSRSRPGLAAIAALLGTRFAGCLLIRVAHAVPGDSSST